MQLILSYALVLKNMNDQEDSHRRHCRSRSSHNRKPGLHNLHSRHRSNFRHSNHHHQNSLLLFLLRSLRVRYHIHLHIHKYLYLHQRHWHNQQASLRYRIHLSHHKNSLQEYIDHHHNRIDFHYNPLKAHLCHQDMHIQNNPSYSLLLNRHNRFQTHPKQYHSIHFHNWTSQIHNRCRLHYFHHLQIHHPRNHHHHYHSR